MSIDTMGPNNAFPVCPGPALVVIPAASFSNWSTKAKCFEECCIYIAAFICTRSQSTAKYPSPPFVTLFEHSAGLVHNETYIDNTIGITFAEICDPGDQLERTMVGGRRQTCSCFVHLALLPGQRSWNMPLAATTRAQYVTTRRKLPRGCAGSARKETTASRI